MPSACCEIRHGRMWCSIVVLWHALSNVWAFHVSLQFDGSLKRPRDQGFPVDSLGRIATASARIQMEDDLILGGKWFVPEQWTSAHAEYEALLLGLEHLSILLPQKTSTIISLHISGDCKMVIQQLRGRASPRKMEPLYIRAVGFLETIACANVTFQHIPREENRLCDRLCAKITEQVVQQAKDSLEHDLSIFWKDLAGKDEENASGLPLSLSKRTTYTVKSTQSNQIISLWQEHFSPGASLIAYSQRPLYYRQLVAHARTYQDFETLGEIGQQMTFEAKMIWSKAATATKTTVPTNVGQILQAQGVRWQLEALEGLGRVKESKRLAHQYAVLLRKHPPIGNGGDDDYLLQWEYLLGNEQDDAIEAENASFPEQVLQWDTERHTHYPIIAPEISFWNQQPILKT